MTDCIEVQKNIAFYLEGVMGNEAAGMKMHLTSCQSCRLALEKEKIFLSCLSASLKAPPAPAYLRSQVQTLLSARRKTKLKMRRYWLWALPPAATGAIFSVFLVCNWTAQTEWAVNTHLVQQITDPQLLYSEINNPAGINGWAYRQANLPLHILPVLPAAIQIQGGRIITDRDKPVVQVVYSGNNEISSLFAMPQDRIGLHGHEVTLNGVTFHIKKVKGHFTVAWSNSKAGYMLVAETEQGINRGCLLCHADEKKKLPASAFSAGADLLLL